MLAIPGEEQWAVEIDPVCAAGQAASRRDAKRSTDHAADQQLEAAFARVFA
jgi:hypothetical protein